MLDVRGYLRLLRTLPGDVRAMRELLDRKTPIEVELARIVEILQVIYDDEPGNRRRLYELRQTPDYELAFTEREPLVSIVVSTFNHVEMLAKRSIPSALDQTYKNVEVVVVGETAPAETEEVLRDFKDERISYYNRNRRGPYPDDAYSAWLVSGAPPANEAAQRAKGRWIAPLDDDDALRPQHVQRLVEAAQAERWEAALTLVEVHLSEEETTLMGAFPPRMGQFGTESVLYHTGLRFIEYELADALFGRPIDWSMGRRWLRMGVRMGGIDEVTADYYPSWTHDNDRREEWSGRLALREGIPSAEDRPASS
jgi:glycosyltransferase involved in cell wall biosynthesis